jgi:hypothetical protein
MGVLWALAMAVLLGSSTATFAALNLTPGKKYCSCACNTGNVLTDSVPYWESLGACNRNGWNCTGQQGKGGKLENCQECTAASKTVLGDCVAAKAAVYEPWPPKPDGQLGQFLGRLALELELLKVGTTPDLVPLTNPGAVAPEGYCRRNDQGQLLVKVFNHGTNEAGASKTLVAFAGAEPESFDTPAIAGQSSEELVIDIPNECFDQNLQCSFTIGVDGEEAVTESDETNNNVAGLCGPQFQ